MLLFASDITGSEVKKKSRHTCQQWCAHCEWVCVWIGIRSIFLICGGTADLS